jgi:hypothetical protein
VSLTWGGIKQLVRLQAVAQQFSVIAQEGQEPGSRRDVGRGLAGVLEGVIDEVHETLRNADPALAEEFERIVIGKAGARLSLTMQAAILTGWLKGAVDAETLEVRIRVGEDRPRGRKVASGAAVGG